MKFLAVFAVIAAVAVATPSAWTLQQLSEALENPSTNQAFRPALEQALDIYMDAIYQGYDKPMKIVTAAGVIGTYTLVELDYTLLHTPSSSIFRPYLEKALNEMMEALFAGHSMESIDIHIPSFELSYWTLKELDAALGDPSTNPALVPYLENALDDVMYNLMNGGKQTATVVIVPADFVAETPVVDAIPVTIDPTPVAVGPAVPAAPASSPLVQIIVNVQQSNVADVASPAQLIDRPLPSPWEEYPSDIIAVLPIEDLQTAAVPRA